MRVTDNPDPKNELEGKFSIYFCAALALTEGKVQESQFTREKTKDHRIRDFMRKTKALGVDSLEETEAHVVIKLKNGAQLDRRVLTPKGDPENPMSFDEISYKFRSLAQDLLSDCQMDQIIHVVHNLEKIEDTSTLLKLCRVKKIDCQ
jgi:2-methylcitrate dehydratase PrpD